MVYKIDTKSIDAKIFTDKTNEQIENNIFCFSALLSAGSSANLNPVLLVEALNNIFDGDFDIIKIHRTGLFIGSRDRLANPLD